MRTMVKVEKMGPLRGDGNFPCDSISKKVYKVEKMGPLRGDGNELYHIFRLLVLRREDGSPSWGRKLHFKLSCISFIP